MSRLTVSLILFAAACGPTQGTEGGSCYPNGTCNEGLVCASDLCVVLPGTVDASVPDGGQTGDAGGQFGDAGGPSGDGGGQLGDAGGQLGDAAMNDAPPALVCNDDGVIDDNNSIVTATLTPIPDIRRDYELVGLSICPTTDIDTYRFRIDQSGEDILAEISYPPAYGYLVLALLDSSGNNLATGVVIGSDPDAPTLTLMRVELSNVAAGTYYVQVSAPPGTRNNYRIYIRTSPAP